MVQEYIELECRSNYEIPNVMLSELLFGQSYALRLSKIHSSLIEYTLFLSFYDHYCPDYCFYDHRLSWDSFLFPKSFGVISELCDGLISEFFPRD